jgi:hypothetical protein
VDEDSVKKKRFTVMPMAAFLRGTGGHFANRGG